MHDIRPNGVYGVGLHNTVQTQEKRPPVREAVLHIQLKSSLCLLNQSGESSGVLDSHLGQALAVHLDTGLLNAVHELGVVQAIGSNSSADTGDPQSAVVTLLQLAANKCVVAGLDRKSVV